MISTTFWEVSRNLLRSGPMTRNATGKGEGGPNTNCVARTRASGASPSTIFWRIRNFKASRASELGVSTTIFAKDGSGSSGL